MSDAKRAWRNLVASHVGMRRVFDAGLLARVAGAIAASEARHRGEIRFVVETACDPLAVWRGLDARQRAIDLFSQLRVWDTAHNSGVLLYVLYAERAIEIVADRGIAARVPQATWDGVCARLSDAYREGDYEGGTLRAIGEITALLAAHFPPGAVNPNELPDLPVVL